MDRKVTRPVHPLIAAWEQRYVIGSPPFAKTPPSHRESGPAMHGVDGRPVGNPGRRKDRPFAVNRLNISIMERNKSTEIFPNRKLSLPISKYP